jgi:hypothetical protein
MMLVSNVRVLVDASNFKLVIWPWAVASCEFCQSVKWMESGKVSLSGCVLLVLCHTQAYLLPTSVLKVRTNLK